MPEIKSKIIEALRKAERPLSLEEVMEATGLNWWTARVLLFSMVALGEIKGKPAETGELYSAEKNKHVGHTKYIFWWGKP